MKVSICLLLLTFLSTSPTCKAQNHLHLCENFGSRITCECIGFVKDLELEDDHDGFFQDAKEITVQNCRQVHFSPPSLVNAELLESLYLFNIEKAILDTELPRTFSNLKVDATNLVELHKPLFNKRQHMKLLQIHNSTIAKISKHTFSELRVERIEFINSSFHNLTASSLIFSDKQIQSDEKMPFNISIKECKFKDVPSNSIAFIGANEVHIENTEFAGTLSKNALFIAATITNLRRNIFKNMDEKALVISNSSQFYFINSNETLQKHSLHLDLNPNRSLVFQENILPCQCKSVCDAQTTAIMHTIQGFYNSYSRSNFDLCSTVKNNFCSQDNSISHIIYLEKSQCDTGHFLYNKLKELNCKHSKPDQKECKSNTYAISPSFRFTLLAVAFSIFSLKRFLFCA